jgi:hypothetical protein
MGVCVRPQFVQYLPVWIVDVVEGGGVGWETTSSMAILMMMRGRETIGERRKRERKRETFGERGKEKEESETIGQGRLKLDALRKEKSKDLIG